jgi:hypothetical protein
MKYSRQVVWSFVLGLIVIGAWIMPLDKVATEHVDAGLKRALVSFATARALNAVISVAQGTEIAATPAGVGVQFSVGQILDPVNNIVEQFAQLMLAASIAFGIEKILISIGAYWMVSLVITAMAGMCAYFIFRQRPLPTLLTKILAVLIMIRFAMPLAIIGSDKMFHEFMAEDYASSQKGIETVSGQLPAMNNPPSQVTEDKGTWDKLKGWTAQHLDVRPQLTALTQAAEKAIEHTINLMVIFLLQTLVLPLLLVWILWRFVKGVVALPAQVPQLTRSG